ncbi:hypothetical protein EVAR_41904_1, partial [Eumeta japonica]
MKRSHLEAQLLVAGWGAGAAKLLLRTWTSIVKACGPTNSPLHSQKPHLVSFVKENRNEIL